MARKGENIYKRKDGRWEGRYIKGRKADGKAIYASVYAYTYQEVRNRLQKEAANRKEQTYAFSFTFGQIAQQWLSTLRYQIKESSYVKYQSLIENHIVSELGTVPLEKLSTEVLEEFIQAQLTRGRVADGKGLSSKTVRDILSIIRQILRWAEGQQHYRIPCQVQSLKVKAKIRQVSVLSVTNRRKLEQFLLEEKSLIGEGILLSLYTGLRIGELCALRWNQILLDEGILQIRYTLQRIPNLDYEKNKVGSAKTKIIVTSPKSSCSNRDIPLPVFLLERIKKISPASENAFFLTGSCENYIEPRCMNNYFKRILQQCGIPETNYHTLRHTFATRCMELNFDAKTLSEILGHSNVNITLNRYVHISLEQKRKSMEMLTL